MTDQKKDTKRRGPRTRKVRDAATGRYREAKAAVEDPAGTVSETARPSYKQLETALREALSVLRQCKYEHDVRPLLIDKAIKAAEIALGDKPEAAK